MKSNAEKCKVIHLCRKNRNTEAFFNDERWKGFDILKDPNDLKHESGNVHIQLQQANTKPNGMLTFKARVKTSCSNYIEPQWDISEKSYAELVSQPRKENNNDKTGAMTFTQLIRRWTLHRLDRVGVPSSMATLPAAVHPFTIFFYF